MATKRTNRGASIDFDSLIAQSSKHSPAVGNMKVNAQGDLLGPGGEIVQKNENRVRKHYQDHPTSTTEQVSLKGKAPSGTENSTDVVAPKTAHTAKENVRTQNQQKTPSVPDPDPDPVSEPDEFGAPEDLEPVGYKEIELPNGDIEMVPVYKDTDT